MKTLAKHFGLVVGP